MYFMNNIVISVVLIQFLRNSPAQAKNFMYPHVLSEIPICGNNSELLLSSDGFESSRIITLLPSEEYEYCTLSVRAPPTHVIHLQILEELALVKHKFHTNVPTCALYIYLEDHMKPIWHGDLCASEPLKMVDLLSPKVAIRWKSSYDRLQTKGRKIIVTSIGHGEFCRKQKQHTCMKIGFDPVFCVSTDLKCDGYENCPQGSKTSDEGAFCESEVRNLWHKRFMGIMNKMPGNLANTIRKYNESSTDLPKVLNEVERTINNIRRLTKIETTTKPSTESRSFGSLHDLLAQYDPWGYLCLGVVLCGSLLLMCCGLWECCIRRYKTESNSNTPPTTVLIVNNYDENGVQQQHVPHQHQQPPNYDDLDLPPSYTALFPNKSPSPDERYRSNRDRGRVVTEIIPMNSINASVRTDENESGIVVQQAPETDHSQEATENPNQSD